MENFTKVTLTHMSRVLSSPSRFNVTLLLLFFRSMLLCARHYGVEEYTHDGVNGKNHARRFLGTVGKQMMMQTRALSFTTIYARDIVELSQMKA